MKTQIAPITHEAHSINYQLLTLVRNGVTLCPESISTIVGIDQETAEIIAQLNPIELNIIAKSPLLYFTPRLNKNIMQAMMKAARGGNLQEIDCNLLHAVTLMR